jgi:hypothetical protein
MMQEVYRDGTLGQVLSYDSGVLAELIKKYNVDHVRVFEIDNGNNVGIPQIEEAVIDQALERKLKDRDDKKRMEEQYKILTSEFDRKVKQRLR